MGVILDEIKKSADVKKLNYEELKILAKELRHYILEVVSTNGGHLAPNLGAVELTIALHKFLNLPQDEIVWDVGHQCYSHKILTGRKEAFATLRQLNGISGFPKPKESNYDAFVAGHGSTSISVAVGLAQAAKQNKQDKRVVAVIGDGALTGGMVYEALNHGGYLKTPFTVILNDNEMSIAENVGSISKYLTRLRTNKRYHKLKEMITHKLLKMPKYGQLFYVNLEKFRDRVKYFLVQGVFFEEMGFVYLGPVDGHDIKSMVEILEKAKDINKPTLIHVITKKGKGYLPAEKNPTAFHGTNPFDLKTGKPLEASSVSFTNYFSEQLLKLAAENDKIIAITAAMPDGTGLNAFAKQYPQRFYDVGIAEAHCLTFAGALGVRGLKPVVAIYSTFLQRAYDQIFHDIALAQSPVVIAVDRAGIVGEDGETHQGLFDIAILRQMPGMTILVPRDGNTLKNMLTFCLNLNAPVAIRYPRGKAENLLAYQQVPLVLGKGQILKNPELTAETQSKALGIFAIGSMVPIALEVCELLAAHGVAAGVADLQFAKPVDEALIRAWAKKFGKLAVLEDGVTSGGVGSACLEALQVNNMQPEVELFGFPTAFIQHGKTKELFRLYGLLPSQIAQKIKERWF